MQFPVCLRKRYLALDFIVARDLPCKAGLVLRALHRGGLHEVAGRILVLIALAVALLGLFVPRIYRFVAQSPW